MSAKSREKVDIGDAPVIDVTPADLPEDAGDDDDGGEPGDAISGGRGDGADPLPPPALAPSSDKDLVQRDTLQAYFAQIGQYPLLTRSQERALAIRAHDQGDAAAAQQLVVSNLRLVVKIAMEYRRVWTNVLDLIQEGNVGLLQAVKRFDPSRNVKLSSYGAYWIRAYILKYLIDNIRTVRMGSSRAERKLFFALNRAKRELEREGFAPEPALLAERLDVKVEDVESMERRLQNSDLSLDAPLSSETGASSLGDLQASSGPAVSTVVEEADMRETFRRHIATFAKDLNERETVILNERLLADDPRTLQDIGEAFDLTRERVRQIEKKLVDKLREYMRNNLVDFEYWGESE